MKNLLLACLIIFSASAVAQINFVNAPRQFQLYPRNLSTNKATVLTNGTVTSTGYTEIKVEVYRNGVLLSAGTQALSGAAGENFSFSNEIVSELAEYKFIISLKDGAGNYTAIYTVDNVVAGDAFIIQGQSNAVATGLSGTSNGYQNEFIRVYGSGDPSFSSQVHQWYLAQGDGDPTTAGNTGQWGIVLADSIVTLTNHPVAVFNGGLGAQLLSYFLPNTANPTDLSTNYGRLLTRVQEAGFINDIRAIFWYQGEANAASNTASDASNYKSDFYTLRNTWIQSYPSTTNFYMAQIRFGCVQHDDKTLTIKEAQREVTAENSNTRIYGTGALTQYIDNCHFPFQNGYEKLGQDFCGIVLQDLYNFPIRTNIESPFVKDVVKANPTQVDLILKNSSNDITIQSGALNDFYFEGASVQPVIASAAVSGNVISLTLSGPLPADATGLTYAERHQGQSQPNIANGNNMAMVNFYNIPIAFTLLPIQLLSFGAQWQNNNGVLLNWNVADESSMYGYEVQYSADGINFEKIGFQAAVNISTSSQKYFFLQKKVDPAINYYRLKIFEKSGRTSYSAVIVLRKNQPDKFTVSIFPNPVTSAATLSIQAPDAANAEITVTNVAGQQLNAFSRNLQKGVNSIPIPGSFPKATGIYYLRVKMGSLLQTVKFFVPGQ